MPVCKMSVIYAELQYILNQQLVIKPFHKRLNMVDIIYTKCKHAAGYSEFVP